MYITKNRNFQELKKSYRKSTDNKGYNLLSVFFYIKTLVQSKTFTTFATAKQK